MTKVLRGTFVGLVAVGILIVILYTVMSHLSDMPYSRKRGRSVTRGNGGHADNGPGHFISRRTDIPSTTALNRTAFPQTSALNSTDSRRNTVQHKAASPSTTDPNRTALPYITAFNSSTVQHKIALISKNVIHTAERPSTLIPSNGKQSTKNDVTNFPCLLGIKVSPDLKHRGGCVRSVNVSLASQLVPVDECVTLKLQNTSTPMCIYDPRHDRVISASVMSTGTWEKHHLYKMVDILKRNPGMDLLDIGSNIGAYTLTAAKSGARVVAVDANKVNLILLSKSVTLGRLQDRVTLVWNALSSKYDKMFMKQWRFNIGAHNVVSYQDKVPPKGSILTESVRLDDLQGLFTNQTLFIKMDVEEHELEVLDGGAEFLRTRNIHFIQMEFMKHSKKPSGKIIVERLKKLNFTPYADCLGKGLLHIKYIERWPIDVCFIKASNMTVV